jgi:hypothetical protein
MVILFEELQVAWDGVKRTFDIISATLQRYTGVGSGTRFEPLRDSDLWGSVVIEAAT